MVTVTFHIPADCYPNFQATFIVVWVFLQVCMDPESVDKMAVQGVDCHPGGVDPDAGSPSVFGE